MRNTARTLALTAAFAVSTGFGLPPAHAAGAVVFSGTVWINCFGCGITSGTAELCVNGVVNGRSVVCVDGVSNDPNVDASFTATQPTGTTCVLSGAANGSTNGDVDVNFNWTRVGAHAVISTTGEINGAGAATFVVTDPIGLVCGSPITARIDGWVAGG